MNLDKKITIKLKKPPYILLCLVIFSVSVFGNYKSLYPFYNFTFGAKALSMANAYTAVSDDLSTVFFNPAGIGKFAKPSLFFSYGTSNVKNKYDIETKDYGSYIEEYSNNLDINYNNIDFFSVSVPAFFLDTKWSFAISYYRLIPYNFNGTADLILKKGSDSVNNTEIKQTVSGKNGIDVLALSAAFAISEYFYFGVTTQQFINSGSIKYKYSSDELDYTKDYLENIRGRNYIFGLLFLASEDISIGFSYHTKFTETFKTTYSYTEDIESNNTTSTKEASVVFPSRFSIGIKVQLLPEWSISYDFAKILWSKGTITGYHNATTSLPYPIRDDFSFTQTDITNSNLGTELSIPIKKSIIFIRGGLSSNRQLFSSSDNTQVKLKGYSCGLGFAFNKKLIIDTAFLYQKGKWVESAYYQSSDSSTTTTTNSNFKRIVLKFSLTYNF